MANETTCRKCGAPVPPGMRGGMCPECLTQVAALLDRAFNRMAQEYGGDGQDIMWQQLRGFLFDDAAVQWYAEVAARMGKSEAALRQSIGRLRQSFREALLQEIAGSEDRSKQD